MGTTEKTVDKHSPKADTFKKCDPEATMMADYFSRMDGLT